MTQVEVTNEEVSAELNAAIVKMAQQARAQAGQSGHCQGYAQAAQCFAQAKLAHEGRKDISTSSRKSN